MISAGFLRAGVHIFGLQMNTATVYAGTEYIESTGVLVSRVIIPIPRTEILQDKI